MVPLKPFVIESLLDKKKYGEINLSHKGNINSKQHTKNYHINNNHSDIK